MDRQHWNTRSKTIDANFAKQLVDEFDSRNNFINPLFDLPVANSRFVFQACCTPLRFPASKALPLPSTRSWTVDPRCVMTCYYYDCAGVPRSRAIDFANIPEVVCSAANAYLGYTSIIDVACTSKSSKALTYFILRGAIDENALDEKCASCGWFTGRDAVLANAECEMCGLEGFCVKCLRAEGGRVLCLRCPDGRKPGNEVERVIMTSWSISADMNDWLLENGYFTKWQVGDSIRFFFNAWTRYISGDLKHPYSLLG